MRIYSGIISNAPIDISNGAEISADVYLQVDDINGCWVNAVLGLTNGEEISSGSCVNDGYKAWSIANFAMVGDACWSTDSALRGHSYIGATYLDRYQFQADNFVNGWHRLRAKIDSGGYVDVFIDNNFVGRTEEPISDEYRSNPYIYLGNRSSGYGGKAFIDNVFFTTSTKKNDLILTDKINFINLTISPKNNIKSNAPITVTAHASKYGGEDIYYKFYYCANYGTNQYLSTKWTVVQDYSINNTATYVFPDDGNYIIVVRAVSDPNNEPDALPIIGQSVSVGKRDSVNISNFYTDIHDNVQVYNDVEVTVNSSTDTNEVVYYKFYYCGNYGTDEYAVTPWEVVQDYSTDNSAVYSFAEKGDYVVVVRAVTNPTNEPEALPIVGGVISVIGDDYITCDKDNLDRCESVDSCLEVGGYWWDNNTCNSSSDINKDDSLDNNIVLSGNWHVTGGYAHCDQLLYDVQVDFSYVGDRYHVDIYGTDQHHDCSISKVSSSFNLYSSSKVLDLNQLENLLTTSFYGRPKVTINIFEKDIFEYKFDDKIDNSQEIYTFIR